MTLVVGNIEHIKNLQMIWKIVLLRKRTMSLSYNKIGTCRIKSKFDNTTNIYWVLQTKAKFFSALSAGTKNKKSHILYRKSCIFIIMLLWINKKNLNSVILLYAPEWWFKDKDTLKSF